MRLRPYQVAAVDGIFDAWRSARSTLLVQPTGTGKTVTFAHVINRMPMGRTLVLAHREELIFQAADKIEAVTGTKPERNWRVLLERWVSRTAPADFAHLALLLGVSTASLQRLGAALSDRPGIWAFPMCDAKRRVIGIRLRAEDGKKWAVAGSHNGLFWPDDIAGADRLARALTKAGRRPKVIRPLKGKDARAWVQAGATRAVVDCAIANAQHWRS